MPQMVTFALDDPVHGLQINALGRVKIDALIALARSRTMLHLKTCFFKEYFDVLFKSEPARSADRERLINPVKTLQRRSTAIDDRAGSPHATFVRSHERVSVGNVASIMFSQNKLCVRRAPDFPNVLLDIMGGSRL